jgi:hypothetical protein
MFLWRSGKILGGIFVSSLKQRKQIRAFVSTSRETGEEFFYLAVCIRLEGAKASVAKDLTVDEASKYSFQVGRVWGYVEVEILGFFKNGGSEVTISQVNSEVHKLIERDGVVHSHSNPYQPFMSA